MIPIVLATVLTLAAFDAPGSRSIVCYSGGIEIYRGQSDPRYQVYLGSQDDHVSFVDKGTHKQTRVGGNCIVRWDLPIQ